jgi:VWFA-related protein
MIMRKTTFLILFSLIFLAIFCVLHGFEKQQEQIQPERHKVEVRLVLVDVLVTKDGKFVTDLTKDDFEVFEDGKRVPINSFELISFEETRLVAPEEKPEEHISSGLHKKQLVVVFDGVCSWQRNIEEGSRKIVDQLVSLTRLGNEVMILQLSEQKGLQVLQPFTTSEELLKKAILKASANIWLDKSDDALKMWEELKVEVDEEMGLIERYDERLHPVLEEEYLFIQKRRFAKTIGGIFSAVNMIKDLPGRKSILLVSDGFPDLTSRTLDSKVDETTPERTESKARSTHLDMRRDVGAITTFDPFNILERKKLLTGEEIIRELINYANAQNISIYSLDPDTFTRYFIPTTAEFGPREKMTSLEFRLDDKIKRVQNLTWLSEDTGAVSLKGAQKYDRFYEVLSTDLNYYYELSFYPQRKEADNEYHKIKVDVNRPGVQVRFRKGYTDYSGSNKEKILLVSAFHNPALFKQLPFEAEFIPLHKDSKTYVCWMNIALPTQELFADRIIGDASKTFKLHVWVKDKSKGDRAFGGQINLPFNIDPSFMETLKTTDYLCFHYKGPEIKFGEKEYEVIFALYDDQAEEIGTWESSLSLPEFKRDEKDAIINCTLGLVSSNPKKGKKSFSLSQDDGSLEYGEIRLFPTVTNRFQRMQNASLFLQIYSPRGKPEVSPKFVVSGEGRLTQRIPAELVAEEWNNKSKVWSGLFDLQLRNLIFGEYTLTVEIPDSEEGEALRREVRLTKLRY